jgi:hypothetical protein
MAHQTDLVLLLVEHQDGIMAEVVTRPDRIRAIDILQALRRQLLKEDTDTL